MTLLEHYLKDKSGEISGKLGLFPTQRGRGILNSLLSSTNQQARVAWAGGNTVWLGNWYSAGGSSAPSDCCPCCPSFSEMEVSLCLGPSLGCTPEAASPARPGKTTFKPVATLVAGVVSGGLPSMRSSDGCLEISRGGLKTTSGLQDAVVLSSERGG